MQERFRAPLSSCAQGVLSTAGTVCQQERQVRREKHSQRRRERRDAATESAKERLDNEIYYFINQDIPVKIEEAKTASERDLRNSNLLGYSQGFSIILASIFDIAEDYVNNNRTLGNFGGTIENEDGDIVTNVAVGTSLTTLYDHGFLGLYGLGFGLPLIVGRPSDRLDCNSGDFTEVVREFGFEYGIAPYLGSGAASYGGGLETAQLSSRICEFEIVVNSRINCILSREDDNEEAAEVVWALEELITAMNSRVALEADVSYHK